MESYVILNYALRKITDSKGEVIRFKDRHNAEKYLWDLFDFFDPNCNLTPYDYEVIKEEEA